MREQQLSGARKKRGTPRSDLRRGEKRSRNSKRVLPEEEGFPMVKGKIHIYSLRGTRGKRTIIHSLENGVLV